MQKLKMYRYADKLNLDTLIFYLVVRFLQFLEKIGIKPRVDGWRKVTQCYLRTEYSKFILTAFRLDFWSDLKTNEDKTLNSAKKHIIERLAQFIKNHPTLHWQISWHKFFAHRDEAKYVDIVRVEFNTNGNLKYIEPYFDTNHPINRIDSELKDFLIGEIIKNYNKTKNIKDKKRPRILKKKLVNWYFKQTQLATKGAEKEVMHFIDRILSATFIQFEKLLPTTSGGIDVGRFQPPCFIKAKHPGFGLLNIVCRFTHELNEADLWIQYSHIPVDGVPMQEILDSLKRQWGKHGELKFPTPDYKGKAIPELCSTEDNKKGVYHISQFIDFQYFLKSRRELNKRYSSLLKGNVTVAALFIWRLSHYSAFEGIKFAIPIDLQANAHRERTLGFVFIRPSIYFDKYKPDKGFLKFQEEFSRQLRATARRRSESYNLLESYALVSPFMYAATLKLMRPALGEFVGTLGVTIIKRADLFISPFSDVHVDGFIAISNLMMPAEDGSRVCNVSIKGPKRKITECLNAIKEVAGSSEVY